MLDDFNFSVRVASEKALWLLPSLNSAKVGGTVIMRVKFETREKTDAITLNVGYDPRLLEILDVTSADANKIQIKEWNPKTPNNQIVIQASSKIPDGWNSLDIILIKFRAKAVGSAVLNLGVVNIQSLTTAEGSGMQGSGTATINILQ